MNLLTKYIGFTFLFASFFLIPNRTDAEELPTPLAVPPIPSPYRCYSAVATLSSTDNTPLGVIWLDGQGNYDSIQNGGGQYGFDSSRGYVYFTSGELEGWIGVYETDEYGKHIRFPHDRGDLPTEEVIHDDYDTTDWRCNRKTPDDETPPWEVVR